MNLRSGFRIWGFQGKVLGLEDGGARLSSTLFSCFKAAPMGSRALGLQISVRGIVDTDNVIRRLRPGRNDSVFRVHASSSGLEKIYC